MTPAKAREGGTVEAVAARMWPTPGGRLGDPKRGMPTPEQAAKRYRSGRRNLDDAVMLWPTPAARDWKDRGNFVIRERSEGASLPMAAGGPLNPPWVEWLMGFPPGWTALVD